MEPIRSDTAPHPLTRDEQQAKATEIRQGLADHLKMDVEAIKTVGVSLKSTTLKVRLHGREYNVRYANDLLTPEEGVNNLIARIDALCDIVRKSDKFITQLVDNGKGADNTQVSYEGSTHQVKTTKTLSVKQLMDRQRPKLNSGDLNAYKPEKKEAHTKFLTIFENYTKAVEGLPLLKQGTRLDSPTITIEMDTHERSDIRGTKAASTPKEVSDDLLKELWGQANEFKERLDPLNRLCDVEGETLKRISATRASYSSDIKKTGSYKLLNDLEKSLSVNNNAFCKKIESNSNYAKNILNDSDKQKYFSLIEKQTKSVNSILRNYELKQNTILNIFYEIENIVTTSELLDLDNNPLKEYGTENSRFNSIFENSVCFTDGNAVCIDFSKINLPEKAKNILWDLFQRAHLPCLETLNSKKLVIPFDFLESAITSLRYEKRQSLAEPKATEKVNGSEISPEKMKSQKDELKKILTVQKEMMCAHLKSMMATWLETLTDEEKENKDPDFVIMLKAGVEQLTQAVEKMDNILKSVDACSDTNKPSEDFQKALSEVTNGINEKLANMHDQLLHYRRQQITDLLSKYVQEDIKIDMAYTVSDNADLFVISMSNENDINNLKTSFQTSRVKFVEGRDKLSISLPIKNAEDYLDLTKALTAPKISRKSKIPPEKVISSKFENKEVGFNKQIQEEGERFDTVCKQVNDLLSDLTEEEKNKTAWATELRGIANALFNCQINLGYLLDKETSTSMDGLNKERNSVKNLQEQLGTIKAQVIQSRTEKINDLMIKELVTVLKIDQKNMKGYGYDLKSSKFEDKDCITLSLNATSMEGIIKHFGSRISYWRDQSVSTSKISFLMNNKSDYNKLLNLFTFSEDKQVKPKLQEQLPMTPTLSAKTSIQKECEVQMREFNDHEDVKKLKAFALDVNKNLNDIRGENKVFFDKVAKESGCSKFFGQLEDSLKANYDRFITRKSNLFATEPLDKTQKEVEYREIREEMYYLNRVLEMYKDNTKLKEIYSIFCELGDIPECSACFETSSAGSICISFKNLDSTKTNQLYANCTTFGLGYIPTRRMEDTELELMIMPSRFSEAPKNLKTLKKNMGISPTAGTKPPIPSTALPKIPAAKAPTTPKSTATTTATVSKTTDAPTKASPVAKQPPIAATEEDKKKLLSRIDASKQNIGKTQQLLQDFATNRIQGENGEPTNFTDQLKANQNILGNYLETLNTINSSLSISYSDWNKTISEIEGHINTIAETLQKIKTDITQGRNNSIMPLMKTKLESMDLKGDFSLHVDLIDHSFVIKSNNLTTRDKIKECFPGQRCLLTSNKMDKTHSTYSIEFRIDTAKDYKTLMGALQATPLSAELPAGGETKKTPEAALPQLTTTPKSTATVSKTTDASTKASPVAKPPLIAATGVDEEKILRSRIDASKQKIETTTLLLQNLSRNRIEGENGEPTKFTAQLIESQSTLEAYSKKLSTISTSSVDVNKIILEIEEKIDGMAKNLQKIKRDITQNRSNNINPLMKKKLIAMNLQDIKDFNLYVNNNEHSFVITSNSEVTRNKISEHFLVPYRLTHDEKNNTYSIRFSINTPEDYKKLMNALQATPLPAAAAKTPIPAQKPAEAPLSAAEITPQPKPAAEKVKGSEILPKEKEAVSQQKPLSKDEEKRVSDISDHISKKFPNFSTHITVPNHNNILTIVIKPKPDEFNVKETAKQAQEVKNYFNKLISDDIFVKEFPSGFSIVFHINRDKLSALANNMEKLEEDMKNLAKFQKTKTELVKKINTIKGTAETAIQQAEHLLQNLTEKVTKTQNFAQELNESLAIMRVSSQKINKISEALNEADNLDKFLSVTQESTTSLEENEVILKKMSTKIDAINETIITGRSQQIRDLMIKKITSIQPEMVGMKTKECKYVLTLNSDNERTQILGLFPGKITHSNGIENGKFCIYFPIGTPKEYENLMTVLNNMNDAVKPSPSTTAVQPQPATASPEAAPSPASTLQPKPAAKEGAASTTVLPLATTPQTPKLSTTGTTTKLPTAKATTGAGATAKLPTGSPKKTAAPKKSEKPDASTTESPASANVPTAATEQAEAGKVVAAAQNLQEDVIAEKSPEIMREKFITGLIDIKKSVEESLNAIVSNAKLPSDYNDAANKLKNECQNTLEAALDKCKNEASKPEIKSEQELNNLNEYLYKTILEINNKLQTGIDSLSKKANDQANFKKLIGERLDALTVQRITSSMGWTIEHIKDGLEFKLNYDKEHSGNLPRDIKVFLKTAGIEKYSVSPPSLQWNQTVTFEINDADYKEVHERLTLAKQAETLQKMKEERIEDLDKERIGLDSSMYNEIPGNLLPDKSAFAISRFELNKNCIIKLYDDCRENYSKAVNKDQLDKLEKELNSEIKKIKDKFTKEIAMGDEEKKQLILNEIPTLIQTNQVNFPLLTCEIPKAEDQGQKYIDPLQQDLSEEPITSLITFTWKGLDKNSSIADFFEGEVTTSTTWKNNVSVCSFEVTDENYEKVYNLLIKKDTARVEGEEKAKAEKMQAALDAEKALAEEKNALILELSKKQTESIENLQWRLKKWKEAACFSKDDINFADNTFGSSKKFVDQIYETYEDKCYEATESKQLTDLKVKMEEEISQIETKFVKAMNNMIDEEKKKILDTFFKNKFPDFKFELVGGHAFRYTCTTDKEIKPLEDYFGGKIVLGVIIEGETTTVSFTINAAYHKMAREFVESLPKVNDDTKTT
jgi:hypothetical protein